MSQPDNKPEGERIATTSDLVTSEGENTVTVTKTVTKRRTRPRWILPALVVASLGITAFALMRPKGPQATPVNVVAVRTDTLTKTVNGTGTAKAEVSRTLSFPVTAGGTGNVLNVNVKVGDEVSKGQELARVDTANTQRDLDAARASLSSAQADLARAEATARETTLDQRRQLRTAEAAVASARSALQTNTTTLNQQEQLLAVGAVSQQSVQTARQNRDEAARKLSSAQDDLAYARSKGNEGGQAAISQARAALQSAQVRVQNLEKNLNDAVLYAPESGVVSAVNIITGNPPPSTQSAIEITNPAQLYLEVAFDETRSASLRAGQPASVQFDALPNRTLQGTVTRVDPVARTSGQVASVNARIRLVDTAEVKPGFTGTATVTTRRLKNALLVPLETTLEGDDGKTKVWKITESGTEKGKKLGQAHPVNVTIVDRDASTAAVEGLKNGDVLVTPAPAPDSLKSGQQVTYSADSPAKGATPKP